MTTLRYRSDIDGLRAVAVLGVILYHAFPKYLPGGFVGVDIFFVISGYLISGILYKGQAEGNFSITEFYSRRIKRLFPALIATVVLTVAYGWLVLLPNEFVQVGKHLAGSTVFAQNVVFLGESGYFDKAADLKPFLHLWSLAVEEQVYLLLPPILLFASRRQRILVPLLLILAVISLGTSLWLVRQSAAATFFLTPFRVWEFCGGAMLAWWRYGKGHEEEAMFGAQIVSTIGFLLVGASMAFLRDDQPYPGWRALLPVAGALLLIQGGAKAWPNRFLLSLRPIVWIGLISYPLYLFHWPALSFVHIVRGDEPDLKTLGIALVIAFGLSVITYYALECRLRHNNGRWTVPTLVGVFVLLGAVGVGVWKGAIPTRPQSPKMKQVEAAIRDDYVTYYKAKSGHGMSTAYVNGINVTRVGGRGPQTVLVGDSNCAQYLPRIFEILHDRTNDQRGAIMVWAGGSCPIPGVAASKQPNAINLMPTFDQIIATNKSVDRVVIAAMWQTRMLKNSAAYPNQHSINGVSLGEPEGRRKALESLAKTVSGLVALGKKVTVVLAVPTGAGVDPAKIYPRTFLAGKSDSALPMPEQRFYGYHGPISEELAAAVRKAGAEIIDPRPWFVTNGICISEDAEGPIRHDSSHLRAGYVQKHVTYLDSTLLP